MDITRHGIKDPDSMVHYLLKTADGSNYTQEEVYELLGKVIDQKNIENFIERLKNLASGGLLTALNELNLKASNIGTIEDLIRHLLSIADEYEFEPGYLWDLILQMALDANAGNDGLNDILADQIGHKRFGKAMGFAGGLILLSGLIIFILILVARRKRRKDEQPEQG